MVKNSIVDTEINNFVADINKIKQLFKSNGDAVRFEGSKMDIENNAKS